MDSILITGAGGFLGSELIQFLLKTTKYNIIGVVRNGKGFLTDEILNHPQFEIHYNIFSDNIVQYFEDDANENIIIHLASQQPNKSTLQYKDYYEANVETTLRLIQLSKLKNIKAFLYISSINVLGYSLSRQKINETIIPSPFNHYSLTKYLSEKLLEIEFKNSPSKVVVIRYPSLVGKNHLGGLAYTYFKTILEGKDLEIFGGGKQYRNLMHVTDSVITICKVLENLTSFDQYEILHAGASDSISSIEIATFIKSYVKSNSNFKLINKVNDFDWNLFLDLEKLKTKLKFEPLSTEATIKKYLDDMIL